MNKNLKSLAPFLFFALFLLGSMFFLPSMYKVPRLARMMLFGWSGALAVALLQDFWLGIFMIYATISTMLFPSTQSFLALGGLCTFGIMAHLFSDIEDKVKFYSLTLNLICGVALLQSAFAIGQIFRFDLFRIVTLGLAKIVMIGQGNPVNGTVDNANVLGAYLALSLPAFFRKKWAWLSIPIIATVILSRSMGAIITMLACGFTWGWMGFKNQRVNLITMALVVVLLFSIFCKSELQNPRFRIWKRVLTEYTNKPITGYGIGQYKLRPIGIVLKGNVVEVWRQVHNEYIQVLYEMGIIGLILLLIFLYSLGRELSIQTILFPAFIGICVNSFFNFPFHVVSTAILILCWYVLFRGYVYVEG